MTFLSRNSNLSLKKVKTSDYFFKKHKYLATNTSIQFYQLFNHIRKNHGKEYYLTN